MMNRLKRLFCFRKSYFTISLPILIVEILIASFVHDDFIRPYMGDYLAVILLYCLIRMIFIIPIPIVATFVLIFSYFIETLQYFKLADRLGLSPGSVARILLGDYFSWVDIIVYTLGVITVIVFEYVFRFLRDSLES